MSKPTESELLALRAGFEDVIKFQAQLRKLLADLIANNRPLAPKERGKFWDLVNRSCLGLEAFHLIDYHLSNVPSAGHPLPMVLDELSRLDTDEVVIPILFDDFGPMPFSQSEIVGELPHGIRGYDLGSFGKRSDRVPTDSRIGLRVVRPISWAWEIVSSAFQVVWARARERATSLSPERLGYEKVEAEKAM